MPLLYSLRIVSPDHVVFEGRAQSLVAPGSEGSFGVLAEHAPMVAQLGTGELKVITEPGEGKYFAVSGGFLEISTLGDVVIIVDTAEAADEIDVERAQAARQRAQQRLAERDQRLDTARAEVALRRALNRLRVAERAR